MGKVVHILLLGAIVYFLCGLAVALAGLVGILLAAVVFGIFGRRRMDEASAPSEMRNLAAEARLRQLEGKKLTDLQKWFLGLPWRPGASWEPTRDEVREFLRKR